MFEAGRIYQRNRLHDQWNGRTELQRQGGILTPRELPIIIVITGDSGAEFGYNDEWDEHGVLHYFGAGQEGDMVFLRGNRALRDHTADGRAIHLFEQDAAGLRYVREVVLAGWYYRHDVPDRNKALRRAIVFKLVPLDQLDTVGDDVDDADVDDAWTVDLDALRTRAAASVVESSEEPASGTRKVYKRSQDLRIYVLRRADGTCEGCQQAAPFQNRRGQPYLEPHHTTRLSDGGPDHPAHVIALCPTCHRRVHYGIDGKSYNDRLIAWLKDHELSA